MKPRDRLFEAYRKQKHAARIRGVAWQLDFADWLWIWIRSGHLRERGPHRNQYVMSRPGDRGPYASWNVRIVKAQENVDEARRGVRRAHWMVIHARVAKRGKAQPSRAHSI